MEWFRFYTETIHDTKIRRLPPAQRWVWVAVLTMASQSPKPGHLLLSDPECNVTETSHVTDSNVSVTTEDLADIARVDLAEVETAIAAFIRQKMLHVEDGVFVVTNWGKRQYVSDSSADRVRRYREKRRNRNVTETSHVTNRNVTVTPPESDTESDPERERDIAVQQIVIAYEETFGPLRGEPSQLMTLLDYMDKGMELELITTAIHKSSNAEVPLKYADKILSNQLRKGIKTVKEAMEESAGGMDVELTVNSRRNQSTRRPDDNPKKSITGGQIGWIAPRESS